MNRRVIASVIALMVVLAACGGGASPSAETTTTAGSGETTTTASGTEETTATAGETGGNEDRELRFALTLVPKGPSHDPMMTTYSNPEMASLYDGLTAMDPETLELVPGLATSWEQIEPTVWQFKLREGVTFHNGEAFTAEDVKFSWDRMADPDSGALQIAQMGYMDSVEVVDDFTVNIITKDAYSPLPAVVRTHLRIVPKDLVEEIGPEAFAASPVGTGPYTFVEWIPDQQITHEANEDYWGGAPEIKRVVYISAPEASTRVSMLLAGEADIIETVLDTDVPRIEDGGFDLVRAETGYINYVSINALAEPFDDVRVRQAMNYAVDVETIISAVLGGNATVLPISNSSTFIGHDPTLTPYPYDPDRARALLAEAGYGEPGSIPEQVIEVGQGRQPFNVDVSQAIAGYLTDVGIPTRVEVLESAIQFERYAGGEASSLAFNGMTSFALHSAHIFSLMFLDGSRGSQYFDTTNTNDLVVAGNAEMDPAEQARIYSELQQIVLEEAPHIFLYQTIDLLAKTPDLEWSGPLPTRELPLATARFR